KCRHDMSFAVTAAFSHCLGGALFDARLPSPRVKVGKSRQIAANEKAGSAYFGSARATDGWHFSADRIRFLRTGKMPRPWRMQSLASRTQFRVRTPEARKWCRIR